MAQIITYLAVNANFTPPQKWIRNIEVKCGKNASVDKDILNYKSVVYSGICAGLLGAYCGILIHRKIFG